MQNMRKSHAFAVAVTLGVGFAYAQDKNTSGEKRDFTVEVDRFEVAAPAVGGAMGKTFQFISADIGAAGKVVKGAPYQAEAVNESVQTLPDGNRITHKNTSSVARDGEGRTRREQSLPVIGPWSSQGEPAKIVFINDPVANVNYVLDERAKTARKMPSGERVRGPLLEAGRSAGPIGLTAAHGDMVTVMRKTTSDGNVREPKVEQLGQKNIEGVVAEGTRLTETIPAGEMGNERPLEIVNERWYSPELQTVVMSKHSDPRFGEATYRLTRISRAEPPRSLFEIPADYQTVEMNAREPVEIRMRK